MHLYPAPRPREHFGPDSYKSNSFRRGVARKRTRMHTTKVQATLNWILPRLRPETGSGSHRPAPVREAASEGSQITLLAFPLHLAPHLFLRSHRRHTPYPAHRIAPHSPVHHASDLREGPIPLRRIVGMALDVIDIPLHPRVAFVMSHGSHTTSPPSLY
ncbi:hypothetical protein C8R44DRAFT_891875 [Mycena epipterygia]|nr:hypothetical protein C8R44DRAFT_891875 [Mycena epipterygia]